MQRLIQPNDERKLEADGLLSPVNSLGFRHIHRRLVNALSNREYKNLPLTAKWNKPSPIWCYTMIPSDVPSEAAFCYIGWSRDMASSLWDEWLQSGARDPNDVLDFIMAHCPGPHTHVDYSDSCEWDETLRSEKISRELLRAIDDPRWGFHVSQEACLGILVYQTMMMRVQSLLLMLGRSQERETALILGETVDAHGWPYYPQDAKGDPPACDPLLHFLEEDSRRKRASSPEGSSGFSRTMFRMVSAQELQRFGQTKSSPFSIPLSWTGESSSFSKRKGILLFSNEAYVYECATYAKRRAPEFPVFVLKVDIPFYSFRSLTRTQHVQAKWRSSLWRLLARIAKGRYKKGSARKEMLAELAKAVLISGDKAKTWTKPEFKICSHGVKFVHREDKFNTRQPERIIEYWWSVVKGWAFLRKHARMSARLLEEDMHCIQAKQWTFSEQTPPDSSEEEESPSPP